MLVWERRRCYATRFGACPRTSPSSLRRRTSSPLTCRSTFWSSWGSARPRAVFPAGLELLEYLGRLQSAGPVVVAVEDLHWADPESRAALLVAARRLSQDRVLMVVTSRPKPAPDDGWERFRFDPSRCLVVPMTRLSLAEVSEMAHASGVSLSPAAAERLYRHTGGHPLYARTLLSEFSPAQLASSDGNLPVPRSLASATVARLAELPQSARNLAAALAVLNHGAPLQVVARVGGVAEPSRPWTAWFPPVL